MHHSSPWKLPGTSQKYPWKLGPNREILIVDKHLNTSLYHDLIIGQFSTLNTLGSKKKIKNNAQCLKIAEKVSFNIASEASYVYILSGQKLIKNAKNVQFVRVLFAQIFRKTP